jgi:CBS domain containing-hemolysin-like protein
MVTLVIVLLGLACVGLFLVAVFALRKASRRVDQIFAEELGHRGAWERYDQELREWRQSLGH